ncbi:hypothetical protein MSG28_005418 [Choristoneura fumiferana]|uniref:Uncharacterized protein n=1 Tax=Choristoneura fumiferana TaxID=7141 RepID=A0ACC0JR75_CHOFU|nr:hypothetical protein MSG28_005418 [Choristoneura fumiferana]
MSARAQRCARATGCVTPPAAASGPPRAIFSARSIVLSTRGLLNNAVRLLFTLSAGAQAQPPRCTFCGVSALSLQHVTHSRVHTTRHNASSSNEAVHLQRRLLSLSSELVTLRNHLHVGAAAGAGAGAGAAAGAAAGAGKPGTPQPAVPPRAPHLLPPPVPLAPPPAHPAHPLPLPADSRWRGGCPPAPAPPVAGAAPGAGAGAVPAGDVDDLIHLRGPLTEDAVVRALQARFYQNKFYTWIGPILVALNGYTDCGNALTLSAARAQRPELARLVHDAVRQQADTGYPQAIILSGTCTSARARRQPKYAHFTSQSNRP